MNSAGPSCIQGAPARGWGEIAVASMLALNDPKLDGLLTAYCQQFGIASRVASFLVLENEADYKQLNLEKERGQTFTGDLNRFLDDAWRQLGRMSLAGSNRGRDPGATACSAAHVAG